MECQCETCRGRREIPKLKATNAELLEELICLVEMTKNHPDFIENLKMVLGGKLFQEHKKQLKERRNKL